MAHLVIVTGLPGSGKSTFAKRAYPTYEHLETDQLFYRNGVYQFKPEMLPNYHSLIQIETKKLLEEGKNVVVANTFSRKWEMNAYTNMPFSHLTVYYIEPPFYDDWETTYMELASRNVHGVPLEVIKRMHERWEQKEGEDRVCV